MLEQSKHYLPAKPRIRYFIYLPCYLIAMLFLGFLIYMIISLKQLDEDNQKIEWINSNLPGFLIIFVIMVFFATILKITSNLMWNSRLSRRQKDFEDCVEIYNECGITDKKYEFKTDQNRLVHQTAEHQTVRRERYWIGKVGIHGSYILFELEAKHRGNNPEDAKSGTEAHVKGNLLVQMKRRMEIEEGTDSIAVGVDLPQENKRTSDVKSSKSLVIIGEKFEDTKDKSGNHAMYESGALRQK